MPLVQRFMRLLTAPAANPAIAALYSACVLQTRLPVFYSTLGVPDTIDGRFDLLVLHVFLVMRRLDPALRQEMFDLMFADMDKNLREMGVGDMGVGKRIKPMIAAFYGRTKVYENALEKQPAGSETLTEALVRNLYGAASAPPEAVASLAGYVRRTAEKLATQSQADLLNGRVEFAAVIS